MSTIDNHYIGCYTDKRDRDLNMVSTRQDARDHMTVNKCLIICSTAGNAVTCCGTDDEALVDCHMMRNYIHTGFFTLLLAWQAVCHRLRC